MKILFFSSYPHFSGSHKMALRLACAAKKAGYKVLIGAPENNEYITNAQQQGFETHIYQAPAPLLPIGGSILKRPWYIKALHVCTSFLPYNLASYKTLKSQNIDLIYFAQQRGLLQLGLATKLAKIPALWHLQSGLPDHAGLLHRLSATLADRIICVSNAVKTDLKRFLRTKKNHKKTQVIYNGINKLELKEEVKSEKTQILFAANLVPARGAHNLLEAALSLPADKCHIRIAGHSINEAYKTYLEQLISRYDITHAEIIGYRTDIYDLMTSSDIIVCPVIANGSIDIGDQTHKIQWKEGFGLTALEAMRAKKPVIASAVHGLTEVVEHEKTGLLIEQDNIRALGDALLRLLNNEEERVQMGEAGYTRFLKHFTEDKMSAQFIDILKEIEHAA